MPIRQRQFEHFGSERGNGSDLYPRWVGARELLLHHNNPYSAEVTEEIQRGFYGHVLGRAEYQRNDERIRDSLSDPEEFVYPVYVVFLLAPSLPFSFATVSRVFMGILLVLTPSSLWLWMRGLGLRLRGWEAGLGLITVMSSYPVVDGLHLQQITLLVAGLMAGALAALERGWLVVAGVLMALTMVKPQLAILVVIFLLLWTLGEWRARWRFAAGFGGMMAVLLGASEVVLPGWFGMWRKALGSYAANHKPPLLLDMMGRGTAWMVAGLAMAAIAGVFWYVRKDAAAGRGFSFAVVAALALTVMVLPNAGRAYYNEVLLVPGVLWMATVGRELGEKNRLSDGMWWVAAGVLVAAWILALPPSVAVLAWHHRFEREATFLVTGPEFLMFFFPLFLGLFLASVGPWACRRV